MLRTAPARRVFYRQSPSRERDIKSNSDKTLIKFNTSLKNHAKRVKKETVNESAPDIHTTHVSSLTLQGPPRRIISSKSSSVHFITQKNNTTSLENKKTITDQEQKDLEDKNANTDPYYFDAPQWYDFSTIYHQNMRKTIEQVFNEEANFLESIVINDFDRFCVTASPRDSQWFVILHEQQNEP